MISVSLITDIEPGQTTNETTHYNMHINYTFILTATLKNILFNTSWLDYESDKKCCIFYYDFPVINLSFEWFLKNSPSWRDRKRTNKIQMMSLFWAESGDSVVCLYEKIDMLTYRMSRNHYYLLLWYRFDMVIMNWNGMSVAICLHISVEMCFVQCDVKNIHLQANRMERNGRRKKIFLKSSIASIASKINVPIKCLFFQGV